MFVNKILCANMHTLALRRRVPEKKPRFTRMPKDAKKKCLMPISSCGPSAKRGVEILPLLKGAWRKQKDLALPFKEGTMSYFIAQYFFGISTSK